MQTIKFTQNLLLQFLKIEYLQPLQNGTISLQYPVDKQEMEEAPTKLCPMIHLKVHTWFSWFIPF